MVRSSAEPMPFFPLQQIATETLPEEALRLHFCADRKTGDLGQEEAR